MQANTFKWAKVFIICGALLLLGLPNALQCENEARGNLTGYIFQQDGTIPVEGAVVKLRNIATDEVFESTASNSSGVFSAQGLASGFYEYVVSSAEGNFVGVKTFGLNLGEDREEMISITINAFKKEADSTVKNFPPPQEVKDASYVGRVLSFDQKNALAQVLIEEGMLRRKDLVRVLGDETDFDMEVDKLFRDEQKVDYLATGETGYLKLKKTAMVGDALYLAKNKGLLPMLLIFAASAASSAGTVVIGAAETSAGTKGIVFDVPDLKEECEPTSPFRNKK